MDMVRPTVNRPAWRALLETRWQQRLGTVTRLSLAYHDAAERLPVAQRAGGQGGSRELRRLMRETVAARRALSDTEEALARLSAGTYGRCEQCAAAIPVSKLAQVPEARYCEGCAGQAAPGPELVASPG
jgi:RNA polymerase-binding transcription factor DksA